MLPGSEVGRYVGFKRIQTWSFPVDGNLVFFETQYGIRSFLISQIGCGKNKFDPTRLGEMEGLSEGDN